MMLAMNTYDLMLVLLQAAHQRGFRWEELKLLVKILPIRVQYASAPFISICDELEHARQIVVDMLKVFVVCRWCGY